MLVTLLLLLATARADERVQELTWDLSWQGKPVGQRTLTVKYVPIEGGYRRVINGETSIDASGAGFDFSYRQKLTAMAQFEASSFHSVVEENGEAREIQGRLTGLGWVVSLVQHGRAKEWELPATEIDLSTADLFDPESRVPLSAFDHIRVLAAETGDVWEGKVERIGSSELLVAKQAVPVTGYAIDPPQGRAAFYYTTDGVLVKYTYQVMGQTFEAVLHDPPPPGIDDTPLGKVGKGIGEVEL